MSETTRAKDWFMFVGVMVLFIIGMVFLLVNKVHNTWIWLGYILLWTWAEMSIAKNIHLKWWAWGIIIVGLCLLDIIILQFIY